MTPRNPTENRRVLAAKSERYPLNKICGEPECDQPVADPHHCFARSLIAGDSYFVVIANSETGAYDSEPVPHVIGLCRAHHDDIEQHRAWIRLEDGEYRWYDRDPATEWNKRGFEPLGWVLSGPLIPQPGSVESKPKKKKRTQQPARKKAVYSIRVPKDESENGYEVLDSLIDAVREKYAPELGLSDTAPAYFLVVAALVKALQ